MPDQAYFDTHRAIGPRPVWQITPPADRPVHTADELASGDPTATPPGGYPLTDHGGSTLKSPRLVLVPLGQWWGDLDQLKQFALELMEFGYLGPLSAYGSGQGTYDGTFQCTAVSGTVTRQPLEAELESLIALPHFAQPDADTLYALLLPDGVTVTEGPDASCKNFCGFHDAFTLPDGREVYYTVQPSTNCPGCNEGDAFAAFTAILAHEVAEACTDAVPGQGWYNDATGMENADEWAWVFRPYGPWTVQGYQVNGVGLDFGAYTPPAQPQPQPSPCQPAVDAEFAELMSAIGTGPDPWSRAGRIWVGWAQQNVDAALAPTGAATTSLSLAGEGRGEGETRAAALTPASQHLLPLPPDPEA